MEELAIKIENVSKEYRLGAIGGGTLKGDLQSLLARVRKKEDPNSKIGADSNMKKGDRFLALDGISFEVKKGEAVGIIGHNGAGKSTLLKLLSRVTAPTKGTIGYNGRIASMLEVGTGFHPELTGRENVYMNGAILGMTKAEIDKKFDQIVEFAEMEQFIDTPVKRYSSGMYVKLAFSVAAHLDSEIMIMDEVLAVGDMKFQNKCLDKMRDAAKQDGRTVLYVSHNMNTIRKLCDRCIVLDHGQIIFEGSVEKAIDIYMGIGNSDDFPVFYDYKNKERNLHFGKQIFVENFRFLNKKTAEFRVGEQIEYEMTLRSKIEMDGIQCVMRIKDHNNTEKIAAYLSKTFHLNIGEEERIQFKLNTDELMCGLYCFSFEIIFFDRNGNYYSYDNPAARIPIRLIDCDNNDIIWSTRYWGNIRLPDAEVEKIG